MKNAKKLFKLAVKARKKAHAPYSCFFVGSALIDNKGNITVGCDIENASYGGTICAERTAIGQMVMEGGRFIREIAVVTDTPMGVAPCGICRQSLLEFSDKKNPTVVYIANLKKIVKITTIDQLLPDAFNGKFLK